MLKALSTWLLKAAGWRIEGVRPEPRRYVLIAAPHTSNWDFILMLLFASAFDIKINWMAKHSLFRPPFGGLMKAMGGIPIHRHENRNIVDEMIEAFATESDLVLTVPAEGTRERTEYWKSGFYHIARQAKVAIVPSYLDFGQKRGGFGAPMLPTGDIKADMQYFRDFYQDMQGKIPEYFGPVRLKEEDEA
jgi:1-acyl-sn-glycerol-3-phosphate acyltransferase